MIRLVTALTLVTMGPACSRNLALSSPGEDAGSRPATPTISVGFPLGLDSARVLDGWCGETTCVAVLADDTAIGVRYDRPWGARLGDTPLDLPLPPGGTLHGAVVGDDFLIARQPRVEDAIVVGGRDGGVRPIPLPPYAIPMAMGAEEDRWLLAAEDGWRHDLRVYALPRDGAEWTLVSTGPFVPSRAAIVTPAAGSFLLWNAHGCIAYVAICGGSARCAAPGELAGAVAVGANILVAAWDGTAARFAQLDPVSGDVAAGTWLPDPGALVSFGAGALVLVENADRSYAAHRLDANGLPDAPALELLQYGAAVLPLDPRTAILLGNDASAGVVERFITYR